MVARINTVAFRGIDVLDVSVEVQVASGLPAFTVVGLPDKAVGESRERVRAALSALGLALPAKRITVNLAPADLLKEGSHFDLPIALGLLAAMDVLPGGEGERYVALGELGLDGTLRTVAGVLPTAIHAGARGLGLICPADQGGEARWAGDLEILAPNNLLDLIHHMKGTQVLSPPTLPAAGADTPDTSGSGAPDLKDVKGQETAKRALEIAASGGHTLLMVGPPGSGKSMLAARLPGLLPPLDAGEALRASMIHSLAGTLTETPTGLVRRRPFRDPHHTASQAAIIGGGTRAKPGEVSLAHLGVLFLDELPEWNRATIEALRQPTETGTVTVARANAHVTYPANFQLIAAMNPCRCGHLGDADQDCGRAPKCAQDYQARISGPMFDRMDLVIDVPTVTAADLVLPPPSEGSAEIAARVAHVRDIQRQRFADCGAPIATNADADGTLLEEIATLNEAAKKLMAHAAADLNLTARGYHRTLRVARTIADMGGSDTIAESHLAEALSFRRRPPGRSGAQKKSA